MSTVKTNALESLVVNQTPVLKDPNGREMGQPCKAWVNFNGSGTVAIRDSFNVAGITDNGVGDYTANFTDAMANVNYCAIGNNGILEGASTRTTNPYSISTSSYRFETAGSTTGSLTDADVIMLAVFAND